MRLYRPLHPHHHPLGTKGQLWGDMGLNQVIHTDFRTGKETAYDITTGESGHGGSDEAIMREFVGTLRGDSQAISLSAPRCPWQSHLWPWRQKNPASRGRL